MRCSANSPAVSPSGRTRSRSPRRRSDLRDGSAPRHRRRRACRVDAGCSGGPCSVSTPWRSGRRWRPAFELVDDRDERLLARERDVARVRLALLGGRAGVSGRPVQFGRALFSRVHPSPHVGLRRVRRARRRPCVRCRVPRAPAKPIADVLEAVPCLVGGEWCSDTTLAK